jgi:hypothetical protein
VSCVLYGLETVFCPHVYTASRLFYRVIGLLKHLISRIILRSDVMCMNLNIWIYFGVHMYMIRAVIYCIVHMTGRFAGRYFFPQFNYVNTELWSASNFSD